MVKTMKQKSVAAKAGFIHLVDLKTRTKAPPRHLLDRNWFGWNRLLNAFGSRSDPSTTTSSLPTSRPLVFQPLKRQQWIRFKVCRLSKRLEAISKQNAQSVDLPGQSNDKNCIWLSALTWQNAAEFALFRFMAYRETKQMVKDKYKFNEIVKTIVIDWKWNETMEHKTEGPAGYEEWKCEFVNKMKVLTFWKEDEIILEPKIFWAGQNWRQPIKSTRKGRSRKFFKMSWI